VNCINEIRYPIARPRPPALGTNGLIIHPHHDDTIGEYGSGLQLLVEIERLSAQLIKAGVEDKVGTDQHRNKDQDTSPRFKVIKQSAHPSQ
jgi:hypothetical protein